MSNFGSLKKSHAVVHRRRSAPLGRQGFTLIELLIAAVLAALVAVSLFPVLSTAIKARDSAVRAVEPTRTADIAFEIIRKDLLNAMPPASNLTAGAVSTLAPSFTSTDSIDDRGRDADGLLFFTTAPGPQHVSGDGDLRRIEYMVQSPDGASGEHLLIRRIAHNLLAPVEPTVFDDEIILRGVAGFNLRFLDGSGDVPADIWDSTQENNLMPTVIEVSIDIERPALNGVATDPPVILHYVRYVQIPCTTAQPSSSVSGLGGGF